MEEVIEALKTRVMMTEAEARRANSRASASEEALLGEQGVVKSLEETARAADARATQNEEAARAADARATDNEETARAATARAAENDEAARAAIARASENERFAKRCPELEEELARTGGFGSDEEGARESLAAATDFIVSFLEEFVSQTAAMEAQHQGLLRYLTESSKRSDGHLDDALREVSA